MVTKHLIHIYAHYLYISCPVVVQSFTGQLLDK